MPKKIRELKSMLGKAGFRWRPRKGQSHDLGTSLGRQLDPTVGKRRRGRAPLPRTGSRRIDRNSSAAAEVSRYSMMIQWSEEDRVFMVILPEFDNALTHGKTYKEAVKQGQDLIESLIIWTTQDGKALPAPEVFYYDRTVHARNGELAVAR